MLLLIVYISIYNSEITFPQYTQCKLHIQTRVNIILHRSLLYVLIKSLKSNTLSNRNERKDTISRATILKGMNALSKHYSAQKKINIHKKTRLSTTHICEEFKMNRMTKVQLQKWTQCQKQKHCMPTYTDERMQEDSVIVPLTVQNLRHPRKMQGNKGLSKDHNRGKNNLLGM